MNNLPQTGRRLTAVFVSAIVLLGWSRFHKHSSQKQSLQDTGNIISPQSIPSPQCEEITLILGAGGTVTKLLTSFGVDKENAQEIADSAAHHLPHKHLKAGQPFRVKYKKIDGQTIIESIEINHAIDKTLTIQKTTYGYESKLNQIKLTPVVRVFEGTIDGSFYSSALKTGMSSNVVQTTVELLSYVVNFQHGIKPGATFKILVNTLCDPSGKIIKMQNIKFIELSTGGSLHQLFAFHEGGKVRFYNARGESISRSLLQTPLQMNRVSISSGFGMRKHPCLGYTRQHKGVDFAAPPGTPVLAAGEGRVIAAGWMAGYGNCVHIMHTGGYSTKYAHLKFISKKIRTGTHVSQRQMIGGVGATGMATGPHLHFEVIHNNKHINPMKVQGLPSVRLIGAVFKKFEAAKYSTLQEVANTKKSQIAMQL